MISGKITPEILKLLAAGRLKEANCLLGSPYSLTGIVEEGSHIGTRIGFPTANIALDKDSTLLLAYGIYAVIADVEGRSFNGMANIGIRPTMQDHHVTVEVNLFDFSRDIYGRKLTVYFIERIREEKKFSGLDELRKNIELDRIRALEILSIRNNPDTDSK